MLSDDEQAIDEKDYLDLQEIELESKQKALDVENPKLNLKTRTLQHRVSICLRYTGH
jgi:hypothetical protein